MEVTHNVPYIYIEKVFDLLIILSREGLWKIMKMYAVPRKMIKIIRDMYDRFQCAVMDDGETS